MPMEPSYQKSEFWPFLSGQIFVRFVWNASTLHIFFLPCLETGSTLLEAKSCLESVSNLSDSHVLIHIAVSTCITTVDCTYFCL